MVLAYFVVVVDVAFDVLCYCSCVILCTIDCGSCLFVFDVDVVLGVFVVCLCGRNPQNLTGLGIPVK